VRLVLAFSVGLVMLGIVLAVIMHGKNFVYSEVSIAALAGVLGAMVNGLLSGRQDDNTSDSGKWDCDVGEGRIGS